MTAFRMTFKTLKPICCLLVALAGLASACAPLVSPAAPTAAVTPVPATVTPPATPVAATAAPTTAATLIAAPLATAAAGPTATSVPFGTLVHLFDYDASVPLDIQETRVFTLGVAFHVITYANPNGGRIGAWLATPPGPGPFAAVLFQVGYGTTRDVFLAEVDALAKKGVVCLVYDSQYNPVGKATDRDQIIQAVINLRRGIDLLSARPDVDQSRIGFVGHSDGANLGGVLSGVDKRVAAYALMSGSGRFFWDVNDFRIDISDPVQKAQYSALIGPVSGIQYIGHAAPAALFFQDGTQDSIVPQGLLTAFQDAGSQPKLVKWYDADHDLNNAAESDRARWLATELKLPPGP